MLSSRKRKFHISLGTVKPTINLATGIFIGQGRWFLAAMLFLIYVGIGAATDFIYWDSLDEAMRETRKRLERRL